MHVMGNALNVLRYIYKNFDMSDTSSTAIFVAFGLFRKAAAL